VLELDSNVLDKVPVEYCLSMRYKSHKTRDRMPSESDAPTDFLAMELGFETIMVEGGKELLLINTIPGEVISGRARKQFRED
jgi:hypothetical protein